MAQRSQVQNAQEVQAYQIYLEEIKEFQKAREQQIADWLESENQRV